MRNSGALIMMIALAVGWGQVQRASAQNSSFWTIDKIESVRRASATRTR
jgi:hypothetical protein